MAMSRRKRAQVIRGVQYAVLVLAILLVVLLADWQTIGSQFFNLEAARTQIPEVITTALVNTAVYTALGFAVGFGLGLVFALMKLSSVGPYRWIATAYIEFFRGIPALLVFIALGFGVPLAFNLKFDVYSTAAIALGLVGSAYIAETLRAGIQAVPKGQIEAARSLGMSAARTNVTVVIPQAFRIILPPLTNELILLTKDSSLIYLLGLFRDDFELAKFGREGLNATNSMTPILLAGLCYLLITVPLGHLSRYLEGRTGRKSERGLKVTA
ncbi:amino acid ABC transporter membrane protein (PAAT family) [Prauserella shujinwangii]|uniref:Amino acid ABC transporter membrane protein (PAAT family) n=1 Tax=Prauserella shujinwangii TaxID=1453103 RepID=A0A2T0LUV7_9PSEU|nr:amino acid ABC transporter permease [Prauserella shujinwangii]PRX47596.1 amino acid ABC transporter membrane protein (PAAT family) [Prauserella shujinwangii]